MTLTLGSAVSSGDTVTVGYPDNAVANPLRDAEGNNVAIFTGVGKSVV